MATAPAAVNGGSSSPIQLVRPQRALLEVPITGLSPLIPQRWSEKAKAMMLAKQQGKPKPKHPPKDPEQEAYDATYWIAEDEPGIPATAFKAAIADAARFFDGVHITDVKQAVYVEGEGEEQLVAIDGEISMREDQPRNSGVGSTADLRYRNQIWPWSAVLRVNYVSTMFTAESVIALADAAGMGGVGSWRPSSPRSKSGTFGRWEVTA